MARVIFFLVHFFILAIISQGYRIKTINGRCYIIRETASTEVPSYCQALGGGLVQFESEQKAVDSLRQMVQGGVVVTNTNYKILTDIGPVVNVSDGVTDHYWWNGDVVDIWATGTNALGNCPALYLTGDAVYLASLQVWMTTFSCDTAKHAICQGPEQRTCGELTFKTFAASTNLYKRSTFSTRSTSVEPCRTELEGFSAVYWFDNLDEMTSVSTALTGHGATGHFRMFPVYDTKGHMIWKDGSVVTYAALMNGFPNSTVTCLRYAPGSNSYELSDDNCDDDAFRYVLCRKDSMDCQEPQVTENAQYLLELTYDPSSDTYYHQVNWTCAVDECTLADPGAWMAQRCQADGNWTGQPIDCSYTPDPQCEEMGQCSETMFCEDFIPSGGHSSSCSASRLMTCQSGYFFSFGQQLNMNCTNGVWDYSRTVYNTPRCSMSSYYIGCRIIDTGVYHGTSNLYTWNSTSLTLDPDYTGWAEVDAIGLTPTLCRDFCFNKGMYWSVLHEGNKCGCHPYGYNLWSSNYENNPLCNMPCEGEPTYFCGGNNVGSAYIAIGGCYEGDISTTISLTDEDMVHTLCIQHCMKNNLAFSLVRTRTCYCLNFTGTTGLVRLSSQMCREPCPGRENTYCGGDTSNIYTVIVNELQTLPETCGDLFSSGVRTHGQFLLETGLTSCYLSDNTTCDAGWVGFEDYCFRFEMTGGNFWEAQTSCRQSHALLATATRWTERTFMVDAIVGNTASNYTSGWWLGYYASDGLDRFELLNGDQSGYRDLLFKLDMYLGRKCAGFTQFAKGVSPFPCGSFKQGYICKKHSVVASCLMLPTTLPVGEVTQQTISHPEMSATFCQAVCTTFGFDVKLTRLTAMVALINGENCTCAKFDDLEPYLALATPVNMTCNLPCPGHEMQMCGSFDQLEGKTLYSAHLIHDTVSILQSCNALYYIGVSINGDYAVNPGNSSQYRVDYCDFTTHMRHCPSSFYYLADSNRCVRPSYGHSTYNGAMEFCASINSLPLVKPEDTLPNATVRQLVESIGLFSSDEFYIGLTDPYNSRVFTWSDGSLVTSDTSLTENFTDIRHDCVTWNSGTGEFMSVPCFYTRPTICVQELEGDIPGETTTKLSCVEESQLSVQQQSGTNETDTQMTLTLCVQLCKGLLYNYGLLRGENCRCFLYTYDAGMTHENLTPCNVPCPGNQYQMCSSENSTASILFKTNFYNDDFAEDCEDLFSQGVRRPGVYTFSATRTDQSGYPTLPTIHFCYGPSQTWAQQGLDWINWREGKFSYKFEPRDPVLPAVVQCWALGYGAYPLSIVDQEELLFVMNVLAADNDLRDVLHWEIGFTMDATQDRDGWMHPDIYDSSILETLVSFSCASRGSCMLAIPGRNESASFTATFRDEVNLESSGLICKTTNNFQGCMTTPVGMDPFLVSATDMSVTLCQELCRGQSNIYAAVSMSSCYCVDDMPDTANSSGFWRQTFTLPCSSRCPGHPDQFCGGNGMALWYSLEKEFEGETAKSCDDIYSNGIFYNSTYVIDVGNYNRETHVCSINCPPLGVSTNADLSTDHATYRTVVNLTCPHGQQFPGGLTVSALECLYKHWNSPNPVCYDTECQSLDIENAVTDSSATNHDSNVTVTCNPGFCVNGHNEVTQYWVTCDVDHWTPAPVACERKRCQWTALNLYIMATLDPSLSFEFGTTLTLQCQDGYSFPNGSRETYVECTDTAVWSPPLQPCVAFCNSTEGSDLMGHIEQYTTGSDWKITVTCFNGYAIDNNLTSATYVCNGSDGWSPPLTSCTRKRCQWTDLNLYIMAAPDPSLSFELGTTLTLLCQDGYAFPNGSRETYVECTDTAVWSPPLQPCLVFCNNIEESVVMGHIEQYTSGSDWKITVTCFDGYAINNNLTSATYVCNGIDSWSPPVTSCTRTCDIPTIPNGEVTTTSPSSVHVTCLPGYETDVSASSHECEDGQWVPGLPQCDLVSCPTLNTSTLNAQRLNHSDSVISIKCLTGFQFEVGVNEKVHICELGAWVPAVSGCVAQCPAIVVDYAEIIRYVLDGQEVTSVTCNTGYKMEAASGETPPTTRDYTCVDNAWNPDKILHCVPATCADIVIDNVESLLADEFLGAAKVEATCMTGFFFSDGTFNKTFLCEYGQWVPAEELCIEVCDSTELNKVSHATVTLVNGQGQPLYHVDCLPGHKFRDGSVTMTTACGGDGAWHEPLEDCNPLLCDELKTLTNARRDTENRTFSTTVTLTCAQGYLFMTNMTSSMSVTCGSSGLWYPEPEYCGPVTTVAAYQHWEDAVTLSSVECFRSRSFLTLTR